MKKEESPQFDIIRNDKFYSLKIPAFSVQNDIVYYDIHLKDLTTNKTYQTLARFKAIKELHEKLEVSCYELPEFPKTHFWTRTNKNPKLIEQRRLLLEKYLNIVINDPYVRGYKEVKNIIKLFKSKPYATEIRKASFIESKEIKQTETTKACSSLGKDIQPSIQQLRNSYSPKKKPKWDQ